MKKLEFPNLEFRIKWAAHSLPMLVFSEPGKDNNDDVRIIMNKRDLHNIRREISEFIKFYEEDFSPENLDRSLTADDFDDYI